MVEMVGRGARKSWREKLLNDKRLPRVEKITDKMSKRWGTGTIVIPAPGEVGEIIRKVPKGKLIAINQIREILARKHGARIWCPITTEIFTWIAAHATEEAALEGELEITPYWRTLKAGGVINEKYYGKAGAQKKTSGKRGSHGNQKGQNFVVADFEKYLVNPNRLNAIMR